MFPLVGSKVIKKHCSDICFPFFHLAAVQPESYYSNTKVNVLAYSKHDHVKGRVEAMIFISILLIM